MRTGYLAPDTGAAARSSSSDSDRSSTSAAREKPNALYDHMPTFVIDDDSTPSRPRPRANTRSHSAYGSLKGPFTSTSRAGPIRAPSDTRIGRVQMALRMAFSNAIASFFLLCFVACALAVNSCTYIHRRVHRRAAEPKAQDSHRRAWDTDERRAKYRNERVVKDVKYYARNCGFDIIDQIVETKDGYLLKVHKVVHPGPNGQQQNTGYPVLIMHGLFQSSGSFITSEERSLAFWLAAQGKYQVYLGNNRGVFDMGHMTLGRGDPRFWDFNIKELALYDLPALVDHVRHETGFDKIAFIGHSQGNGTMFCSLAKGMVPELGRKISVFVALAPAVYAGALTAGFPFTSLKNMQWRTWRTLFGVHDFIPLMRISYDWTPSRPFGLLGYQMFAYLFNWTDHNWLLKRKAKMFRFTPSPVSSASIFWWTGYNGFSTRGCALDTTVDQWYGESFPPLAIYHGSRDYLVLTDPLLERLRTHETNVKIVRTSCLKDGEHCDFFWHIDAVELCFQDIMDDIEKTRRE